MTDNHPDTDTEARIPRRPSARVPRARTAPSGPPLPTPASHGAGPATSIPPQRTPLPAASPPAPRAQPSPADRSRPPGPEIVIAAQFGDVVSAWVRFAPPLPLPTTRVALPRPAGTTPTYTPPLHPRIPVTVQPGALTPPRPVSPRPASPQPDPSSDHADPLPIAPGQPRLSPLPTVPATPPPVLPNTGPFQRQARLRPLDPCSRVVEGCAAEGRVVEGRVVEGRAAGRCVGCLPEDGWAAEGRPRTATRRSPGGGP